MKENAKVAVIGAGVTGITTCYQLMQKGADVTVFEANPYPAMETSYANGGQLSASPRGRGDAPDRFRRARPAPI